MSVLVYIDYDIDRKLVRRESLSLIHVAQSLTESLRVSLEGLVVNSPRVAKQVADLGLFTRIYDVQIENLREGVYDPVTYAEAVTEVCRARDVAVLLFPTTLRSREIAPYVAARLSTGIVADVSNLYVDEKGEVISVKPSFGENVLAHISIPGRRPKIFTVRTYLTEVTKGDKRTEIESIVLKRTDSPRMTRTRSVNIEDPDTAILPERSTVVIGVGAGVLPENIKLLREVARRMGIGLAATKKVTDRGLLPDKFLVGESGKLIRPRLYIALGISGAPQHMTGVKESKIIVAVNISEKAPIVKQCDYFVRADANELIRLLVERVLG